MDFHGPMTPEEMDHILGCVIEYQFTVTHPFKTGRVGLKQFAKLMRRVPELNKAALEELLPPLERLLENQEECEHCRGKLLAFLEILFGQQWPEKSCEYGELLDEHHETARYGRDYRQEVQEAINREE